MKNDRRSCECNLCNCVGSLKKFRTLTEFELITSRYHCDAHSSFDLISAVLIF